MARSHFNNTDTSSSEDINDSEEEHSETENVLIHRRFQNIEQRNELRTFYAYNMNARNSNIPKKVIFRNKSTCYKKGLKHVVPRKSETYMKNKTIKRKSKNVKASYTEQSEPSCLNILHALQICETMMKEDKLAEEAAEKARAEQKKKRKSISKKAMEEKSLRPQEMFQTSTSSSSIFTNSQLDRVEVVPSTSSASDDYVSPLQELIGSREGDLFIRSYRIPNYRKFSTEEITLPSRDVVSTLDLDRDSNDYFVIQDLPNITTERIAMALKKAEEEFFKELAQENEASCIIPQRVTKQKDKVKIQKGPEEKLESTCNEKIMKEKREKEEAEKNNQLLKKDKKKGKKNGSKHHK